MAPGCELRSQRAWGRCAAGLHAVVRLHGLLQARPAAHLCCRRRLLGTRLLPCQALAPPLHPCSRSFPCHRGNAPRRSPRQPVCGFQNGICFPPFFGFLQFRVQGFSPLAAPSLCTGLSLTSSRLVSQALVVRHDLKMGKGKVAAQCRFDSFCNFWIVFLHELL